MGGNLFYQLGKKVGKSWYRGRYLYKTLSGNSRDSLQAEYELGVILSREIESQSALFEGAMELLLIESILGRLQKRVKNKQRYFHVKILVSDELNAFALPGGFIYLTDALVKNLADAPDALAFVLAHEMIHIILKHPLKRMITSFSLDTISRVLKTGSAMGMLGKDVLKKLLRSRYSQANELLADEYGFRLMYSAGFDTRGALHLMNFFKTNKKAGGLHYFATHPSIDQRITYLKKLRRELTNI